MKNARVFMASITAIVVIAGFVGFFITFQTMPQIAFARIFIDVGMLVALLSVCTTIPKTQNAQAQEIAGAMDDLAKGEFARRLTQFDSPDLEPIVESYNHLARHMRELKNKSEAPVEVGADASRASQHVNEAESHSHHPELGPVKSVIHAQGDEEAAEPVPEEEQDEKGVENPPGETHERQPRPLEPMEQPKNPTLVEVPIPPDNLQAKSGEASVHKSHITTVPHNAQDLRTLYQEYCKALELKARPTIEWEEFKGTIEDSTNAIKAKHTCDAVRFDVVVNDEDVALRPHLVR